MDGLIVYAGLQINILYKAINKFLSQILLSKLMMSYVMSSSMNAER